MKVAVITVTSGNAIVTTCVIFYYVLHLFTPTTSWIPQIITSTISGSDSTNTTSNTGDIVVGIIGGIAAMCLLGSSSSSCDDAEEEIGSFYTPLGVGHFYMLNSW
jgi:hypothetical protein